MVNAESAIYRHRCDDSLNPPPHSGRDQGPLVSRDAVRGPGVCKGSSPGVRGGSGDRGPGRMTPAGRCLRACAVLAWRLPIGSGSFPARFARECPARTDRKQETSPELTGRRRGARYARRGSPRAGPRTQPGIRWSPGVRSGRGDPGSRRPGPCGVARDRAPQAAPARLPTGSGRAYHRKPGGKATRTDRKMES